MSYRTLMVNLEVGHTNTALVRTATDLAERCKARLVGIAACQPNATLYSEGVGAAYALDACMAEIETEIRAAETIFRAAAPQAEWRSDIIWSPVADYVAQHACVADLLVINPARPGYAFDAARQADPGDLLMQAGRPVLVVPQDRDRAPSGAAMICWKDTGESRRAIADALPLLRQSASVTLVELAPAAAETATRARLAEIVAWLDSHGIVAAALAPPATGNDAVQLADIAARHAIDLVVAGAYGHSRIREWALGGVTRALLADPLRCVLLSR